MEQIAQEKALIRRKSWKPLKALLPPLIKEYGKRTEVVKAKLDFKSGDLKFWQVKTVVDKTTVREEEEAPLLADGTKFCSRYQ